jgi:hypothetical protein
MPETPSLEKEDREMLSQKFVRKEKKNDSVVSDRTICLLNGLIKWEAIIATSILSARTELDTSTICRCQHLKSRHGILSADERRSIR